MKITFSLIVALAVLALSGCSSTPHQAPRADKNPSAQVTTTEGFPSFLDIERGWLWITLEKKYQVELLKEQGLERVNENVLTEIDYPANSLPVWTSDGFYNPATNKRSGLDNPPKKFYFVVQVVK